MKEKGLWRDCLPLRPLWEAASLSSSRALASEPYFLEIGANVGCCTAIMITQGIRTVAFEPGAPNLFYLTSTVVANEGFSDHLTLYPFAASDSYSEMTLYVAEDNAGHAVLDKPISKTGKQKFFEVKIRSVVLDDILWPDPFSPPPHIKVMKIDVEGYEMHVLGGAKRLLKAGCIGTIRFEVVGVWLSGQGTSAKELLSTLHAYGFEIYDGDGHIAPEQYGKDKRPAYELTAKLRR
jgi:FkbM family methyltransferase